MAEIDSIIAATLTAGQKDALALNHIAAAFAMPRKNEKVPSSDPADHAQVIHTAIRTYLTKKHARIESIMPDRLRCPITKELMRTPVLATDETTYELEALQSWFETQQTFPCRGPLGRTMTSTSLTLNRAVLDEIAEFTMQYNIVTLPPQAVPQPPSSATFAPTSRRASFQPSLSVEALRRLNLPLKELLKHDTFLCQLRKQGLCAILNKIQNVQYTADMDTKDNFITRLMRSWPTDETVQDEVVLMLDSDEFIQCVNGTGLDLVLSSMGWMTNGNVHHKIQMIRKYLPLKVTITDWDSQYELAVNRSYPVTKLYAMVSYQKALLRINGEHMLMDSANLTLGDYVIKNGTNIDNRKRYMYAETSQPMSSSEYQITIQGLIKDLNGYISPHIFGQVVHPNMTVGELKDKNVDKVNIAVNDQRLLFNGKPLENNETLLSNGVNAGDTLHLVPGSVFDCDVDYCGCDAIAMLASAQCACNAQCGIQGASAERRHGEEGREEGHEARKVGRHEGQTRLQGAVRAASEHSVDPADRGAGLHCECGVPDVLGPGHSTRGGGEPAGAQ